MKLALLLPQFAPNLYDLAIMLQANCVLLQDNDQWSRKSRVHRARIRTVEGTQWINIPIRTEDRSKPVNEIRIDHDRKWIKPLERTLTYNYRSSIYFDFYGPDIISTFKSAREHTYLLPFVLKFQRYLFKLLKLNIDFTLTSDIPGYSFNPDKTAKQVDADTLFQEYSSRHYLRQAERKQEPVFNHPEYYQHFNGFEPNCCLLDLLFQKGPESFKVIEQLTGHH